MERCSSRARPKGGRRGGEGAERGRGGGGPGVWFPYVTGSPHKMKARALSFPGLRGSRARSWSGLRPDPACSSRTCPARCSPPIDSRFGDWVPRGRPRSNRRLPAEMPGKKARKSAQPSPTRAPAGRDQMGRRSWPGRGGRDGGRGLYRGRVSPSTRGLGACSGLRPCTCFRGASWKSFGVLSRTVETARDPGLGLGGSGLSADAERLFVRLASALALPRPRGRKVQMRVPATRRKSLSRRVGTGEALGTTWPPSDS